MICAFASQVTTATVSSQSSDKARRRPLSVCMTAGLFLREVILAPSPGHGRREYLSRDARTISELIEEHAAVQVFAALGHVVIVRSKCDVSPPNEQLSRATCRIPIAKFSAFPTTTDT
jgi:hypothetical protein